MTTNWRKPYLQPLAANYGVNWLCRRVEKEKGVRPSKRRMRRQLAKLRASLRRGL